jgi:hypothetical protein
LVIKRINKISEGEKQGEDLLFTNRNGNEISAVNAEHGIVTAGVDTEISNKTGNDNVHVNEQQGITDDNQPVIMNGNEKPGITMESEETIPHIYPENPGVDHPTKDTANDNETI